jgi:ATP-dependent Lon protease
LENEIKIHLVTVNSEEYIESFKEKLEQLDLSLEALGISFSFEFSPTVHDRSIALNNGWKILLGRGLDIWQKTNGWFDLSEFLQKTRQCKECEITYLRT